MGSAAFPVPAFASRCVDRARDAKIGSAAVLDWLRSDDEVRVVGCVRGLAMNVADVTAVGVIGGRRGENVGVAEEGIDTAAIGF